MDKKKKLEEILNSSIHLYDNRLKEYFKENEVVELTYESKETSDGTRTYNVWLNDVKVPYNIFVSHLGDWLIRSNKVIVKSLGEISFGPPLLSKLNVGSVDFSKVVLPESLDISNIFLEYSEVGSVILPLYPRTLQKLSGVLRCVKVDESINLSRPFRYTRPQEIGAIFEECEFNALDFSKLDFSNVRSFNYFFSALKANTLVLPKNIGKNVEFVSANRMFNDCEVGEIKNLEYFPFDKLVNADRMFHKLRGLTKLEIDSKLKNLVSAAFIFSNLRGVRISLPNVEKLPRQDDWFTGVEDCKIYIPKLNVISVLSMNNINDTNEIFCNEQLARKLN